MRRPVRITSHGHERVDEYAWLAARNDPAQTRDAWYADIARTRQIPLQRLGKPEEVARAIAFLCSPAAAFITGAQLEISGGTSRHI